MNCWYQIFNTRPARIDDAITAAPLSSFDALCTAIMISGTWTLGCLTRTRVVSPLVRQAAVAMFHLVVCLIPQLYTVGLFVSI